jgi:hypothetical protein
LSNVLQVRGNLALLAGFEALHNREQEGAVRAFEEAQRVFEQLNGTASTTDQRPYVRQLLADGGQEPATSATIPVVESAGVGERSSAAAAEPVAASASAPHTRRRWWRWGR